MRQCIKSSDILFFVVAISIFVLSSAPANAQSTYQEVGVKDGGRIRGFVRLTSTTPHVEKFQITKNPEHCGIIKPSDRLVVGKNRGIKNSIVSLEGITEGKKFAAYVKPTLDQRKCEYVPHVQVIPAGTPLEIVNSDKILHNVHAYTGEKDLRTVFNIAQPIKGQRTIVKQSHLTQPGLLVLTCDAGHPWMTGCVMLADHPYYAVTDPNGKFELTDVPPGTYKIKMWHEGFKITGTEMEKGKVKKYYFEDPYEVVKTVSIPAKGDVAMNFDLVPR